jgi:hypothetical protein
VQSDWEPSRFGSAKETEESVAGGKQFLRTNTGNANWAAITRYISINIVWTLLTPFAATEILFLSSNAFSGQVPAFVGNSLRGLYLSENKLQGRILESLCQQVSLEALFLDENQFTGSIPACIGNLSNLKQLYLFKNQLTGFVPVELGRLRNLSKSFDSASGQKLTLLLIAAGGMGLEKNDIQGTVPSAICATPPIDFWSDCGGSSPEVDCPCCNVCCPSDACT